MKYEFYKKIIDTTKSEYFMVKSEDNFSIFEKFEFTKKNKKELQEIIDGIEKSKFLNKGEEYYRGSEEIDLYANKNGVLLIDQIAQLGGEYDPDNITLRLTHEEMLTFLQDFKKFVDVNS